MQNIDDIIVREEKKSDYEYPTPGMVDAICCGIWNVGVQKTEYMGDVKYRNKIVIGFILDQVSEKTGAPMIQYEAVGLSLFEKSKLYQIIKSWTSKTIPDDERPNYDLKPFVGKRATLNLVQNNEYINIGAVLPPQQSNKVELIDPFNGETHPFVRKMLEKSAQAVLEKEAIEANKKVNLSEIKPLDSDKNKKAPF